MVELRFELRGKIISIECESEYLEGDLEWAIASNFPKEMDEYYPLDFLAEVVEDVSEYKFKWEGYDIDLPISKVVEFANEVVEISSLEDMANALEERPEKIDNYYDFSDPEDFFNTYFEDRPYEAVRAVYYGDVKWNDDYIMVNGYGNLETVSEIPYEDYANEIIDRFISERC